MDTFTLADLGVILRNIVITVLLILAAPLVWDRRDIARGWWDAAVKHFTPTPRPKRPEPTPSAPDGRTDGRTDAGVPARTELPPVIAALQVDRTRAAVIAALLYSGWTVTQIRGVLKGENAAIAAEVAAAAERAAAPPQKYRRTPEQAEAIDDLRKELGLPTGGAR